MSTVDSQALGRVVAEVKDIHVREIAEDILAESQRLVPVDSGRLKRSGKVVETDDGFEVVYDAPYAAYVEHGTINSPAQPFLTPAATRRRS